MKKKTLCTKIIATILSVLMLVSIFVLPGSAAETEIPKDVTWRDVSTTDQGFTFTSIVKSEAGASVTNKRQTAYGVVYLRNIGFSAYAAWSIVARNSYDFSSDIDTATNYMTLFPEMQLFTDVIQIPYDESNIDRLDRIFTYFDYDGSSMTVEQLNGEVQHTFVKYYGVDFAIHGY